MDQNHQKLSQEDRSALYRLQQQASNLHQSSSNKFLVSLEGLMLSAIAWESIGKKAKWISNLSKATTAIGLAVTGIFAYTAMRDQRQANKADEKLKQYGFDEFTLPCEVSPVQAYLPNQPQNRISPHGAHAVRLYDQSQEVAM